MPILKKMLAIAREVEKVLGELCETPFEPLKEKQEEHMTIDTTLDKQVTTLNESFINFFKGTSSGVGKSFFKNE
jgi:hypothetical protein